MPKTGRDLRVERTKVGIKQLDLAARMGVHRNTVKRYEDLFEVPAEVAEQYLTALQSFVEQKAALA